MQCAEKHHKIAYAVQVILWLTFSVTLTVIIALNFFVLSPRIQFADLSSQSGLVSFCKIIKWLFYMILTRDSSIFSVNLQLKFCLLMKYALKNSLGISSHLKGTFVECGASEKGKVFWYLPDISILHILYPVFWIWYILFYECMALRIFCILYVLHFAHFALCTFCKCLIFTRYFHFAQGGGGSHFWMHRINQHVGCSAPLPPKLFILLQLCCKWKTLLVRKHQIAKSDLQNTHP